MNTFLNCQLGYTALIVFDHQERVYSIVAQGVLGLRLEFPIRCAVTADTLHPPPPVLSLDRDGGGGMGRCDVNHAINW